MRPLASRLALFATAFTALAGMGVVHGLVTDRWAAPEAPALLDRVPFAIGDWDGTPCADTMQMPPSSGTDSTLLRRYVNRNSGAVATLYLEAGRPGPLVESHTPDICYPQSGFACAGPVVKQSVVTEASAQTHEFRVATYGKTERASPIYVRIFWSWTATGSWQAPEVPRLAFAGRRRLYKIYVLRQLLKEDEPLDEDPIIPFIQALAPELEKTLVLEK